VTVVCSLCVPVSVTEGRAKESQAIIVKLWNDGYAATDIIQTLFRVSHGRCLECSWVLMFCFALTGDPYNGSARASQVGVHSRDRLHTHAYRGRTEYEVAVVRVHWSFVFAETSAINVSTQFV
jgi:hypothetical protein